MKFLIPPSINFLGAQLKSERGGIHFRILLQLLSIELSYHFATLKVTNLDVKKILACLGLTQMEDGSPNVFTQNNVVLGCNICLKAKST